MIVKKDFFNISSIFLILFYIYLHEIVPACCIYEQCDKVTQNSTKNSTEPLFLTPLLEKGEFYEARCRARVEPITGNLKSYSGFFTVNKTYNTNYFFWFFPAEKSPETAPIVVCLQGGPGTPLSFGVFDEHGPYYVEKNGTLSLRKYSWTKTLSMLYIDNPIETGFSFTDYENGYTANQEDAATNLHKTIVQFFQLFPELSKNEFYIIGESYGAKFTSGLAFAIHERNKISNSSKINLKGIALGSGFVDPINMLNYGEYLQQLGLIDTNTKAIFDQKQNEAKQLIKAGKLEKAFDIFNILLYNTENRSNFSSLFTNITGLRNLYNYRYTQVHLNPLAVDIIQEDFIRQKIHVGNVSFISGYTQLKLDIMQSVAPWIRILLDNNYKVLIFNGQLDILVGYPLTLEFLRNLQWSGAEEYKNASRHIWKINPNDTEVAGYVRMVRNLTEVLVRNAGHFVPLDQPQYAYDLITRFIFGKSFL